MSADKKRGNFDVPVFQVEGCGQAEHCNAQPVWPGCQVRLTTSIKLVHVCLVLTFLYSIWDDHLFAATPALTCMHCAKCMSLTGLLLVSYQQAAKPLAQQDLCHPCQEDMHECMPELSQLHESDNRASERV